MARQNLVTWVGIMAVVALAGCSGGSQSRLNPKNWFGNSAAPEAGAETATEAAVPSDPRGLVARVATLRAEPVPGGAIIRATGLPQVQGYFDGELVPLNGGAPVKGVLTYEFRANSPLEDSRTGPPKSREVIVGTFVSDQNLAGVRQIRVNAAGNALVVRR